MTLPAKTTAVDDARKEMPFPTAEDHQRASELKYLDALNVLDLRKCYRELSASYYAAERSIAELEPRAAFGDQCYQDRCEGALVEYTVLKRLEAQLSEQRTTIERLEQERERWVELAVQRTREKEQLEGELRLLADWFEDQPNDKDGGVSALQCIEKLRALATITTKPEESPNAK